MKFEDNVYIQRVDKRLLDEALTHTSYSNEHKDKYNYERLEYLGDAVLELIISEYFYKNTTYQEGKMTKKRASYVCEEALAKYAKGIDLPKHIKVGHGQIDNINDTIIADVFESVLGSIYLSQGFEASKEYIYEIVIPYIKKGYEFLSDYKTAFQEVMQTDRKTVEYVVVAEHGKPNEKTFEIEVRVDGITYGKGIGHSKKEAEQKAAQAAYHKSAK